MSSRSCYSWVGGSIFDVTTLALPCGTSQPGFYSQRTGIQTCCVTGDACGANSICEWSSAGNHPPLGSGYYIGGCTGPTFRDPHCRRDCQLRVSGSDIVFVQAPGTWACCAKTDNGANRPNCSHVLEDQAYDLGWGVSDFPGPVDRALTAATSTTLTVSSSSTSSTSSAATTTSVQSTLAPTPSPVPTITPPAAVDSLTTGAKAGIGVGSAVGILAILGLIGFFALRTMRRRASQKTRHANDGNRLGIEDTSQKDVKDKKPTSYPEMPAGSWESELGTERPIGELPA